MTAQTMEILILNGDKVKMASNPLKPYLDSLDEKPHFWAMHTGCWRGYVGTWEIIDENLYLINIDGYAEIAPKKYGKVDMNYLFPNQEKVFAEWFTGEVRIPQGDMLNYVHGGYESTFEKDMFLVFNNGQLIGHRTVDNILEEAKELINKKKEIPPRIQNILKKETIFTRILQLLKWTKNR